MHLNAKAVHRDKDGEEGFPGKLDVICIFTLVGTSLNILYEARTNKARISTYNFEDRCPLLFHFSQKVDTIIKFEIYYKPTVVSLTHHPYFNLNGHRSWSTIDDLHLTVQTKKYLDTDEENVPTGQINDGTGTFMDLSSGQYMTQGLIAQTPGGYGYDMNYCFASNGSLQQMAILASPKSGRLLEVKSTLPGLQVYTGNWLNTKGKFNVDYLKNTAIALEPQYWPDSPNHANFPSTTLRPGQRYSETIQFNFYQI